MELHLKGSAIHGATPSTLSKVWWAIFAQPRLAANPWNICLQQAKMFNLNCLFYCMMTFFIKTGGLSVRKEILDWGPGFIFLLPDNLYLYCRWVQSTALWLCLWRDIWLWFTHLPSTGKLKKRINPCYWTLLQHFECLEKDVVKLWVMWPYSQIK